MFLQDLRHAFRTLSTTPGFSCSAFHSLALGIVVTVAMFTLGYAVLLNSLPFPNSERLVLIRQVWPKFSHLWSSLPVQSRYVLLWRKELHSFESLGVAVGKGSM